MLGAALTAGVTPVEVKEIVYQAVPYVGLAKVFDFLHATNDVLTERGVELPLPGQSTTTPETRNDKGMAVQKRIVGDDTVDAMYAAASDDEKHFQRSSAPLSANATVPAKSSTSSSGTGVVMCRCLLCSSLSRRAAAGSSDGWQFRGDAVLALAGLRGNPAGRRSSKAGRVFVYKSMQPPVSRPGHGSRWRRRVGRPGRDPSCRCGIR